jgi:hypothetical protein
MWYSFKTDIKYYTDITDFEEGSYGFIYRITHKESKKYYIGKKILYNTTNVKLGVKETNNKLSYAEINPAYIASMARRMGDNKGKYPRNNWKHDIDKNEILDALERHLCDLKLLLNGEEPIHSMVENPADHLAALGCNSMILNYLVTRKI